MNGLIRFNQVCFQPADYLIFDDVSFTVQPQEYIMLKGHSGSGKSSILRMMVGLESPTAGQIFLGATDYNDIPLTEIRQKISYFHQLPQLLDDSVRANILLPYSFATNKNHPRPDDAQIIDYLRKFDLKISPDSLVQNCSVGEQQRICMIRNLLLNPQILLLDEPAAALDKKNRDILFETIEQLTDKTVILIDHSDYWPSHRAYKVFEIQDKKMVVR